MNRRKDVKGLLTLLIVHDTNFLQVDKTSSIHSNTNKLQPIYHVYLCECLVPLRLLQILETEISSLRLRILLLWGDRIRLYSLLDTTRESTIQKLLSCMAQGIDNTCTLDPQGKAEHGIPHSSFVSVPRSSLGFFKCLYFTLK